VALAPGANIVTASADVNGTPLTDTVSWTAPNPAKGIAIDAGALTGLTTAAGQRYGSDDFFDGRTCKALAGSSPFRPAPPVAGVDTPALFATYREGRFGYDIPLPDGRWTVSLAMLEPDAAKAAERRFSVAMDGKVRLTGFSPAEAAGGVRKAVTRSFPVRTRGGHLPLDFVPGSGDAVVAAITVLPR